MAMLAFAPAKYYNYTDLQPGVIRFAEPGLLGFDQRIMFMITLLVHCCRCEHSVPPAMLAALEPVGPGVAMFGVVKQPSNEVDLEHGHRCATHAHAIRKLRVNCQGPVVHMKTRNHRKQ